MAILGNNGALRFYRQKIYLFSDYCLTSSSNLGIGSSWARPADEMVMAYVPEGGFSLGSNSGSSDEHPVHIVYLGVYIV
jgi:hypothetical protein